MAYASSSDLIVYCDERVIADLCTDNGYRPTPSQLLTNANVTAALSAASGQVNTATLSAGRYSPTDLSALTGDDQAILTMMVSWLAFGILCSRRGRDARSEPFYVQALEMLDQLKKGERIFNVPANVAAGTPVQIFPSAQQYAQVNTIRTNTYRLFPIRRTQQDAS